jgi:hypothetical protein
MHPLTGESMLSKLAAIKAVRFTRTIEDTTMSKTTREFMLTRDLPTSTGILLLAAK